MNLIPFVKIAHTYGLEPEEQGIYKVYSQSYDQEIELHEYYCSNPNCHCRKANLMFYESGEPQASDLLFQFEVDLDSLEIHRDRISPKGQAFVDQLADEYIAILEKNLLTSFQAHYSLAKRYGIEHLGYKANTVGRNDPCLCGSGKKYKKCCGA